VKKMPGVEARERRVVSFEYCGDWSLGTESSWMKDSVGSLRLLLLLPVLPLSTSSGSLAKKEFCWSADTICESERYDAPVLVIARGPVPLAGNWS